MAVVRKRPWMRRHQAWPATAMEDDGRKDDAAAAPGRDSHRWPQIRWRPCQRPPRHHCSTPPGRAVTGHRLGWPRPHGCHRRTVARSA
uniref:Uncharacterized protein n=1 Tax=Oryza sativa subsp. japonica TaxID=39947 RepID=Q8H444_ORYSJ|nr:hypothetical protein [Oryza sativa Japonica Group]